MEPRRNVKALFAHANRRRHPVVVVVVDEWKTTREQDPDLNYGTNGFTPPPTRLLAVRRSSEWVGWWKKLGTLTSVERLSRSMIGGVEALIWSCKWNCYLLREVEGK